MLDVNGNARHSRGAIIILIGILLVGAGLRVRHLTKQSLWLDELWNVEISVGHGTEHGALPFGEIIQGPDLTHWDSTKSIASVWNGMAEVTWPPLGPVIQRVWMMGFGTSEAAVRSLPLVCSLLATVLLCVTVRQGFGTAAGLWAAALMATAGPQIQLSQDARPYTMMLVFGLWAIYLAQRIVMAGMNWQRLVGLTVALFCLQLLHYFSVAALGAVFLFAMWQTRGRLRVGLISCVFMAALLFAGVWGMGIVRQIPRFSAMDPATLFLHDTSAGHQRRAVMRVIKMPISLLSERPMTRAAIGGGILLYGAGIWLARRRLSSAAIWILWYVCVIGLLFLLDFTRGTMHLNFIRYPLLASPAVYALVGAARPAGWPKIFRPVIPLVALLLCLATVRRAYVEKSNYRALGQSIAVSCRPGDLVVFAGLPGLTTPRVLYLGASYYTWPMPGPVLLLNAPAGPALMKQMGDRQRLMMVCTPGVKNLEALVPGFRRVSEQSWPRLGRMVEMDRIRAKEDRDQ